VAQLKLTVTELIDAERAERLARKLRDHLELAPGPYTLFRKGADPSLVPQFIQLIGDAAWWLPLTGPAAVFLTSYLNALGPIAAQATRDGLAALFKKDEVKPVADVAAALAEAREGSGGRIEIVFALDIPDRHLGTALVIGPDSSPEDIAYELALFATRAEELSATMKAEVEAGRAPSGRALVTPEKDGSISVRWHTLDGVRHEKRIR
jgi:hypothetical protein